MSQTAPPRVFPLIIALVALGPFSTDLYLPALPALVADLATDVAHGQLTLTAYLIGFEAIAGGSGSTK